MKKPKSIWTRLLSGILYTSLFAAACATSMVMASERLYLGYLPPWFSPLHQLVFGSTLIIYNIHHLLRRPDPQTSDRFAWTLHHRRWHGLFIAMGAVLALRAFWVMPSNIQHTCLILGLLSLAYSIPLVPIRGGLKIREIGGIKILVLTLVWTWVTALLPLSYWQLPLWSYPFETAIRFFLLFTLCLAFDLRDMQTDQAHGIHTIPNQLGIKKTNQLMDLGLVLFLLFSFLQFLRFPQPYRLVAEVLTFLATKSVLIYSQKHPSDRAYLGLVDGMMLFYAGLILITASL